ncbi:dephospho-CoA kinase [Candidatus Berkiella cookevillensis]|uniref:Dephospho-CoA kinase n=1 Tax=Candidatus Berkiella cookevillensis TaxID=437022 RepID=A0A0Q9YBQ1_9GAMM|nr:dephospho-CoA kinase [Candidatus Berkiella cookevillensis]MCS5709186.1 dephospho-CoA kinase [Candidatus Berkiella cookevillensis]
MTYVVALTGGIGSGKSTVSDYFATLGVPVIDTDVIARELVAINHPCYEAIVQKFGNSILDDRLSIDRRKLREIIFHNADAKKWLENLLHPQIKQALREQISKLSYFYCLIVVPLLVENFEHYKNFVNRVLLVDSLEEHQINRTMARDHSSLATVKNIIASQASREARLAIADDILLNNKELKILKQEVELLHQKYLQKAQELIKPQ